MLRKLKSERTEIRTANAAIKSLEDRTLEVLGEGDSMGPLNDLMKEEMRLKNLRKV